MASGFRRVMGLAATWALIWAVPGMMIEALANVGVALPFTRAVDMWPQTLGIPGLFGGVFFGVLLAVRGSLPRFEALPAAGLVAWGVTAGALVCVFLTLVLGVPRPMSLLALLVGIALVSGAVAAPLSAWGFRRIARGRGVPRDVAA